MVRSYTSERTCTDGIYIRQRFPSACPVALDGQHLWTEGQVIVIVLVTTEGSNCVLYIYTLVPEEEAPLLGCGGRVRKGSRWDLAELLLRPCLFGGAQACFLPSPFASRLACSTPTSDLARRECSAANSATLVLFRDISCKSVPLPFFWLPVLRFLALLLRLYCVCRAMISSQRSWVFRVQPNQPRPLDLVA